MNPDKLKTFSAGTGDRSSDDGSTVPRDPIRPAFDSAALATLLRDLKLTFPKAEVLSVNIAEHDATFKKILGLVETFVGPSVSREFKTLADVKGLDLENILSDISVIENPAVVLAFNIAVIGTWNLSRDKELTINLPGHSNPVDCYNSALKFLDTEAEKTQIKERFLEAQVTPEAASWFQQFYASVGVAQEVNRNSLALVHDDLRNRAEIPQVSILDRGPEKMSSLGKIMTVPQGITPFAKADLEERKLRIPNSAHEKTLQELLTAIYGGSSTYGNIKERTQVEDFSVALPMRPGEGSVEFLVKLFRQRYHQNVLMITGDNKLYSFTLLPKNDSRIASQENRESVFCGVPNEIDRSKESPFTASVIDVLTRERKNLLLNELSMSESCSVVFIMIPQEVVPQMPSYNDHASSYGALTMKGGAHTAAGSGYTGSSYLRSSDRLQADSSKLPRVIRLNTFCL